MEIVVGSRTAPWGAPGLVRHQDAHESTDRSRPKDEALRALMTAGMSEQTAREQILRLSAGDVWSG